MKEKIVIIFLIFSLSFTAEGLDITRLLDLKEQQNDTLLLQTAKLHIIRGSIHRAGPALRKIFGKNKKIYMIKKYYQAIIDFIQGDYQQSFSKLKDKRYEQSRRYYRQVCQLQLLNMMAIGRDKNEIKDYAINCQSVTSIYSKNRQLWMKSLIDIHLRPKFSRTSIKLGQHLYALENNDILKTWINTALYLNQNDVVLNGYLIFPDDVFLSKSIRELIGFAHYRTEKFKKAYSFLEDINSANAENIKGGIALEKKDYSLAFDHFKKAFEKKYNSVNSFLRLISLCWKLEKWEEGLRYTDLLISKLIDPKEIDILKTAFLIRLDRPKEIRLGLNRLQSLYKDDLPVNIEMMNTYGHIILGNKKAALESSDILCEKLNGLACLIHSYLNIWPNIGKTLNREDKIYDDPYLTFETIKEKQKIEPLAEAVYINQRDIDELDESDARLGELLSP